MSPSMEAHFSMRAPNGHRIHVPVPGYGTYTDGDVGALPAAIAECLQLGYRHLDCAWEYGVNAQVREGIALSGVPRDQIFITSKLWCQFHKPEHVSLCLDNFLDECDLEYVDLFLIHHPVALQPASNIESARNFPGASLEDQATATGPDGRPMLDPTHSTRRVAALNGASGSILPTWNAMAALVRSGKARAIGVSNFTVGDLQEIVSDPSYDPKDVPLSCNQIEIHPWHPCSQELDYMRQQDILAVAYSPFAALQPAHDPTSGNVVVTSFQPTGTTLLCDPLVTKLAAQCGMSPGQLLQSWAVQKGAIPLGRTGRRDRMIQNRQIRRLCDAHEQQLDRLELDGLTGKSVRLAFFFAPIKCEGNTTESEISNLAGQG